MPPNEQSDQLETATDLSVFVHSLTSQEPPMVQFESASSIFIEWCKFKQLPDTIIAFFRNHCVKLIDPGIEGLIYTQSEIRKWNDSHPAYLHEGLLQIGSAANGDPVVIDLQQEPYSVGYLSHEKLWGYPERKSRDYFIVVASSLGRFATTIFDDAAPGDYFSAKNPGWGQKK